MRVLFAALLLGSLLQLAQAPAAAAPAAQVSAQMTVRAGFDGLGKVGGWLPIEVEIRNDGPDIDGEIQLVSTDTTTTRGTYTRAPVLYSAPIVLPRRSHKQVSLDAELRTTGQKITARLVEGDNVIAEQEVQLARVAAGELLCGVLSRSGPSFDFLPTMELPPPLRRARVAHLEVNDLPTRPQLLASLDCLILDNIATNTMLDAQRDALSSWVHGGGLLVVIGGPTWQRTISGLPEQLLPVKVNGLISLDSLDRLSDLSGEPIQDAGPWLVSQATVTDGNPIVDQDGVLLMAASRRGSGTVVYMAMDPTAEPLRSWTGTPRLWRYVLSYCAGGVGLTSSVANTFAGWGRIPRNAMVDISAVNGPTPGLMMLALALFAIAVGPFNYLLLKQFGRPSWSIVTIPLITVLAAVGTFSLAGTFRDSDIIMSRVSLVRAYQTAPAYGRSYVSLLSRRPTRLDVQSSETSLMTSLFYPFPRDPNPDAPDWALRVVEGVGPSVDDLGLGAGALGTFVVDSQINLPGQLESDLRVDGRQLVGTITNRMDSAVYDASLIVDYQVVRLGDLKSGESREVAVTLTGSASAGFGPPTSFSSLLYPGSNGAGRRMADGARRDVLDSVFGSGFNFTRLDLSGVTVIGWLDGSLVPLIIPDTKPAVTDTTLIVASLPIGLPKGYEGELPPQAIARRQIGATTLNRQQYGSYDLASGESIAFQFTLPVGTGKFLLDGLLINIDGRLRGAPGAGPTLGEVSIFNWQRAEWEDRIVGFGRNLVKDASPYVSATGDVRVRYTFKAPPDTAATGVSFSRFDVTASGLMQ